MIVENDEAGHLRYSIGLPQEEYQGKGESYFCKYLTQALKDLVDTINRDGYTIQGIALESLNISGLNIIVTALEK